MIVDFARKIHFELALDLETRALNGERFSLVFDEWTSLRNRRYMNITF